MKIECTSPPPTFYYRLQLQVQEEIEKEEQSPVVGVWSEFVADLWKKHLPHLREELHEGLLFFYHAGSYGFPEEDESSDGGEDGYFA